VHSEGLIVVGVDGSESAQAALEFALEEAARWSAHVRAVTAFHPPEYWPDADLLVVGHRGRGGIARACLGSVGLQCVLHAACPVVVVRPTAAPAARAEVAAVPEAARA
jgi:nucleotide-binding universal stress UspA family protein